jgi:prophage DNA circulation protein
MAFRDQLLPASLDGVPFDFKDTGNTLGRRTVTYEFPDRDEPFVEDLGRRARRFSIDAIVLEPNYFAKRDALIEVLERGGVHTLVHPYRGTLPVRIDAAVDMRETIADGGMASFRLVFVEAGTDEERLQIPDTTTRVNDLANRTVEELSSSTSLSILDTIQDVAQAAINGVNDASSALRKVRGKIAAKMNTIESLSQAIRSFESEVSQLLNTPQQLVNQFAGLVASVLDLVRTAAGITDAAPRNTIPLDFNRPEILRESFRSLRDFTVEDPEPPDTTPQRQLEASNQDAIEQMVAVAALAETSRIMATLTLESANQAQAIRDELADAFETQLNSEATEDPLFEALQDLRTEIVTHLQRVAQDLPVVSLVTPPISINALVLAYSLYGDADQDLDIVTRNDIANPNFIPGGVEIEVLSSDA